MKELKVIAYLNTDNLILGVEPVKKATQSICHTEEMTMRLYTPDEIDRETAQCMQDGVHTYHREHGRVKQDR